MSGVPLAASCLPQPGRHHPPSPSAASCRRPSRPPAALCCHPGLRSPCRWPPSLNGFAVWSFSCLPPFSGFRQGVTPLLVPPLWGWPSVRPLTPLIPTVNTFPRALSPRPRFRPGFQAPSPRPSWPPPLPHVVLTARVRARYIRDGNDGLPCHFMSGDSSMRRGPTRKPRTCA